jgi:ferrochelatase
MRYWHPLTEAAVAELAAFGADEIVLLPLYPQYSKTTTGSSLNEWNRCFEQAKACSTRIVETFYEDSAYLDSVVAGINRCLDGVDLADLNIVFSAHSVPVAVIEAGDPYQRQIEHTVDLVWERGGWPARRHTCYQSKVGASKWLRPSMHETVKKLAADGSRHVLVVPISFVSDHVETLHEIDIEHREQARALGISDFRMMPGLNDSPDFIRALAGLVRAQVEAPAPGRSRR